VQLTVGGRKPILSPIQLENTGHAVYDSADHVLYTQDS